MQVKEEWGKTLSIILSITSSDRFMPDSASVATTICFTCIKRHTKIRIVWNEEKQNLELNKLD